MKYAKWLDACVDQYRVEVPKETRKRIRQLTAKTLSQELDCPYLTRLAFSQGPRTFCHSPKVFAGVDALETLKLNGTRVTDAVVAVHGCRTNLRELDLSCTLVTDYGVSQLKDSPSLRDLVRNKTAVTNASLEQLANISTPKSISGVVTRVTDVELIALLD